MIERRSEPRLPMWIPVRAGVGGNMLAGISSNLSRSGMMILMQPGAEGIEPGETLPIECDLPGTAGRIEAQATVVWTRDDILNHRGEQCRGLGVRLGPLDRRYREALETTLSSYLPTVLVVGSMAGSDIARQIASFATVEQVEDAEAALECLDQRHVTVLVCGEHLPGTSAADFLQRVVTRFPQAGTVNVVLAAGEVREAFQELVDEDELFYLSSEPLPVSEIGSVIRGAIDHHEVRRQPRPESRWQDSGAAAHVLDMMRNLARAEGIKEAAPLIAETVVEIMIAERVHLLLYDPIEETLSAINDDEERVESAAAGLVGFVARSGSSVLVPEARSDPRFDQEADDPPGSGDEQLLVVPVVDSSRRVLVVLVAVRSSDQPRFSQDERDRLRLLAGQLTPVFQHLTLKSELEAVTTRDVAAMQKQSADIYRQEALEYHEAHGVEGRLLDLSPAWTRWTYWLVLTITMVGLAYICFGRIHEYAEGPAVVRVTGRAEVIAAAAGTVTAVEVSAGQKVAPGDLLVRLYDAQELASLERIRREFDLQLIASLRDPADESIRRSLATLRAQKDLAEAQLELREIRASSSGTVSDIRVRVGQLLAPGDTAMSIVTDQTAYSIVAFIPGHYRPQMSQGAPLRFEITGYQHAYQMLRVDHIGDEIIGPAEARRFLGPDADDSMIPAGPAVVVRAQIRTQMFEADRRQYSFFDGMLGTAEVQVRSQSILLTLIPDLKAVVEGGNG
jgi:membrane fusion protein (multidrug efflux system)